MGATLRTTYACAPCGAISDVTLTDLWAWEQAKTKMVFGVPYR